MADLTRAVEAAVLTDAQRADAVAALAAAEASLRDVATLAARVAQSQQEIDNAPTTIANARAALAQPTVDPAGTIPPDLALADLEQRLSQARAALDAARTQATALEAEPAIRQARREAIPGELAAAQNALEQALDAIQPTPAEGVPAVVADATRLAARARVDVARARIESLQRELASLDARRESILARIDLARRELAERDALVKYLEGRLSEARRQEAARQAQAARDALIASAQAHPEVQHVLRDLERLATRRADDPQTGTLGAISLSASATRAALDADARLRSLALDYAETFQRVATIGLTDAMGRLLREKRRSLDDASLLESQIRRDRETRSALLLELFELRPLGSQWGEPAPRAAEIASAQPDLSPEQREVLQAQLIDAMERRRAAYRELIGLLESYEASLGRLDTANTARLALLREYQDQIDRTVLWVPSHHVVDQRDLAELLAGLRWLADADAWRAAALGPGGVREDIVERPIPTLGPLLVVLLLALFVRPWLHKRTDALHEKARKVGTDRFSLTLQAMLMASIIAMVLPATLLAVGHILRGATEGVGQARAFAIGLQTAAGVLFAMALTSRLTRRGGLAEVHFRWSQEITQSIRAKVRWLTPLAVLTHPLIAGIGQDLDTPGGQALIRLGLVIWLLAVSLALRGLLAKNGAVIRHSKVIGSGGWIDRLRWLWLPAAIAGPILLAAIALLGYVETARQLEERFMQTLALVLVLLLVSAVVARWIALARRRVAMEQAKRRLEALEAERAKELGVDTPAAPPPPPQDDASLQTIDAQTRQLLRFGVGLAGILGAWGLWVGVLPALGMLDRVELWPQVRISGNTDRHLPWRDVLARGGSDFRPDAPKPGSDSAASADPAAGATQSTRPAADSAPASPLPMPSSASAGDAASADAPTVLTLGDLLTAMVLGLATAVAAKNVPGVVEILLLQRLPLDRGSRYAVSTIVRYIIVILGASLTFSAIGIGWSRVQWLAAALTFGLGFGLQEIFANFVSGIIILAERPIRIGDVVTVGDVTGTVSRIQMRATTVVDWDKRELIVPNRSFITGSVINWTLSDPSTRIVIPVGVAHGSDPNLVKRTLLAVGKSSRFLKEPPEPSALFRNFGASSMDFELRFFIRNMDDMTLARDEALRAIDREFKSAGIQIAYPQLDLHVRDVPVASLVPPSISPASGPASSSPPAGS